MVMAVEQTNDSVGFYHDQHDHLTGKANAPYTRVSHEDRVRIAAMLRMGIEPRRVVCFFYIFLT
jgi:hypothetical protein